MFNKLKSNESDFSSLQHDPFLDLMNKNILYLTHTLDKCLLVLKKLEVDTGLQKQVDEYFEKDPFGSSFNTAQKTAAEDEEDEE